MADPFKKVRPGEPVVFSANAWNAMLGAGRVYQQGEQDRLADDRTTTRRGDIVRVKNESGADLGRFAVLGLDTPIFTPTDDEDAFLREVAFRGVTPAADHSGKFAILLEPAPADRVVRAYLAGVCPVQVDMIDVDHDWADIEVGETGNLNSADAGPAQILWVESGTGIKWAVVRIGAGSSVQIRRAEADGAITARSGSTAGTGTIAFLGDSGYTATGETAAVTNDYTGAITDGTFLWVINRGGGWRILNADCPAA